MISSGLNQKILWFIVQYVQETRQQYLNKSKIGTFIKFILKHSDFILIFTNKWVINSDSEVIILLF